MAVCSGWGFFVLFVELNQSKAEFPAVLILLSASFPTKNTDTGGKNVRDHTIIKAEKDLEDHQVQIQQVN